MKSIASSETNTWWGKLRKTLLGMGFIGAFTMAVGFATPTFAHDNYSNDGNWNHQNYSYNYDHNRDHCNRGEHGWYWDWRGDCECQHYGNHEGYYNYDNYWHYYDNYSRYNY